MLSCSAFNHGHMTSAWLLDGEQKQWHYGNESHVLDGVVWTLVLKGV